MKPVTMYCFSGTGNTLLVARAMRDEFAAAGIPAAIRPLEKSDPGAVDLAGTIGLAFPVAVFSTFPLVWRFVEGLPETGGAPVFMVDTLGGASGGIVGPLRRVLLRKGYVPLGAREIVMPSNFMKVPGEAKCRELIAKGCAEARVYARELADGKASWPGSKFLVSRAVCAMSRAMTAMWRWRISQRMFRFHLDRSLCTKCGLCARLCPTGNIAMDEWPAHGARCEYCMRCGSFCPAGALRLTRNQQFHRAVQAQELLEG